MSQADTRTEPAAGQPPLHMRRDGLDPTPVLGQIRESVGVASVTNAFGMQVYLVTRHEDVKTVLSDHARFSNGRPPGFVVAGAPPVDEEEAARIARLIRAYGPLKPFTADPAGLVALTAKDKKNRSGMRSFILPTGIGSCTIVRDMTEAELLKAAEAIVNDAQKAVLA